MVTYSSTSPWHTTAVNNEDYLSTLSIRPVPASSDDVLYTVESQYNHRPDLLSYDLYGTPKLWWVFAQRNMDVIKDPVYDLVSGVKIYIPQVPKLRQTLGT